jgi:hypothetical protein
VDADGEVVDDPDRHPGAQCGPLRRGQLVVEAPLQPHVELDPVGHLVADLPDGLRARVARQVRPGRHRQPVPLRERAPGGEVDQAFALPRAEGLELRLPGA